MSNKRKIRNKKHTPRKVNAVAHLKVVMGAQPLSEGDKASLYKQAMAALNGIQFGRDVTQYDFTTLSDVYNVTAFLYFKFAGDGANEDNGMRLLSESRDALQDSKQRYLKAVQANGVGRWGFTGPELIAVKDLLALHLSIMDVCTYQQFCDAFDTQKAAVDRGEYFHREGDLRPADVMPESRGA